MFKFYSKNRVFYEKGITPIPIHIGVSSRRERGFIPPLFSVFSSRENNSTNFGVSDKKTNFTGKVGGFTLVETLVAISILLMAVVAPLVFISSNIALISSAKDKTTALYLAEDAIDFVKYKIDTNFNTPQYWLTGLPDSGTCTGPLGSGFCRVDSFADNISSCGFACPDLLFNSSTGIYGHTSGTASKFKREVSIIAINPLANDPYPAQAPQEVVITATVSWQDHGAPKQTTLSEHAFAWGT